MLPLVIHPPPKKKPKKSETLSDAGGDGLSFVIHQSRNRLLSNQTETLNSHGYEKKGLLSLSIPAGAPPRDGDIAIYVFDIKQLSLSHPFYSLLVSVSVFMALSTVFHSMNSPDNYLFYHSVPPIYFCLFGPFNYRSLYERLLQP